MTNRPGAFPRLTLGAAAFVAIAALLATTAPARAGIGNPLKKVKEKIAQKAAPSQPQAITNDTVVFDDVTLELTDERIGKIVGTFKAAKAAGAGRQAAVDKLNKASQQKSDLWDKHGESIMELQRKRDEINGCLHDGYREAQDKLTQEYAQKALTDPAIREKFTKAAMEHNAAAAKGDTAAIRKLNETIFSETIINHEDSVAVQMKCGTPPPPTPQETQIAALDKEIAAHNEEIRAIDMKVAEAQSKEGGMTRDQFAMANERLQMYSAWKKSKSKQPVRGFTDEEIKAIEKRLTEIEESWNL